MTPQHREKMTPENGDRQKTMPARIKEPAKQGRNGRQNDRRNPEKNRKYEKGIPETHFEKTPKGTRAPKKGKDRNNQSRNILKKNAFEKIR